MSKKRDAKFMVLQELDHSRLNQHLVPGEVTSLAGWREREIQWAIKAGLIEPLQPPTSSAAVEEVGDGKDSGP